jgi:hypothetical protein
MSGFPNQKSFARGLKAGLPSNTQGGAIIPLNHSSKPLSSEDACGKSVGSAIGGALNQQSRLRPHQIEPHQLVATRKTQWMSKRCPNSALFRTTGDKNRSALRPPMGHADHNPYVRFGSTPVIENSEPNFCKGVESGYSIKPPECRQCAISGHPMARRSITDFDSKPDIVNKRADDQRWPKPERPVWSAQRR